MQKQIEDASNAIGEMEFEADASNGLVKVTVNGNNEIRKIDALISLYFHLPFPELLDDETWIEKFRQIEWLADKGLLGAKRMENE